MTSAGFCRIRWVRPDEPKHVSAFFSALWHVSTQIIFFFCPHYFHRYARILGFG